MSCMRVQISEHLCTYNEVISVGCVCVWGGGGDVRGRPWMFSMALHIRCLPMLWSVTTQQTTCVAGGCVALLLCLRLIAHATGRRDWFLWLSCSIAVNLTFTLIGGSSLDRGFNDKRIRSAFSSSSRSLLHLSLYFVYVWMWETFPTEGKANGDQPAHVERHGCSLMWLQLRSPGPNEVPWRLRCSSSHRLHTSSPHTAMARDH